MSKYKQIYFPDTFPYQSDTPVTLTVKWKVKKITLTVIVIWANIGRYPATEEYFWLISGNNRVICSSDGSVTCWARSDLICVKPYQDNKVTTLSFIDHICVSWVLCVSVLVVEIASDGSATNRVTPSSFLHNQDCYTRSRPPLFCYSIALLLLSS